MEKCKYCTACKADILEAEPDVKKHEDSSNDNGNYCISSHLIADSSGNALCLNQGLIYIKLIHKCLVQSFTLVQSQCAGLNDNLLGSNNLGRLYILISCYFFYNRCNLRINGLNVQILIKGNIGRSTA